MKISLSTECDQMSIETTKRSMEIFCRYFVYVYLGIVYLYSARLERSCVINTFEIRNTSKDVS
jgi:hypothetical protein